MTSAQFTQSQSQYKTGFADALRGQFSALTAWWRGYRTMRILSGLDERTLKDIGANVPGGPSADAEARVLRHLETLR